MRRVTIRYFASLRDAAGMAEEHVETACAHLQELYEELRERHGFAWTINHLRVAVDGDFTHWESEVRDGSEVAFIPPVSGG